LLKVSVIYSPPPLSRRGRGSISDLLLLRRPALSASCCLGADRTLKSYWLAALEHICDHHRRPRRPRSSGTVCCGISSQWSESLQKSGNATLGKSCWLLITWHRNLQTCLSFWPIERERVKDKLCSKLKLPSEKNLHSRHKGLVYQMATHTLKIYNALSWSRNHTLHQKCLKRKCKPLLPLTIMGKLRSPANKRDRLGELTRTRWGQWEVLHRNMAARTFSSLQNCFRKPSDYPGRQNSKRKGGRQCLVPAEGVILDMLLRKGGRSSVTLHVMSCRANTSACSRWPPSSDIQQHWCKPSLVAWEAQQKWFIIKRSLITDDITCFFSTREQSFFFSMLLKAS